MNKGLMACLFIFVLFAGLTGCAVMLPSTKVTVQSPWQTFDDCKTTFDQITLNKTTSKELERLFANQNVTRLNYLDIQQRFMPNTSISKEDLDPEIKKALDAKNASYAYEIMPQTINNNRSGNFWLDIFRFKRETIESGWQFKALIVIVNDIVVYKLWGGTPKIDKKTVEKKPLGPIQELGDMAISSIKSFIKY